MKLFSRLITVTDRQPEQAAPACPCGGTGTVDASTYLRMTGGGAAFRGSYACPRGCGT